MRLRQFILSGLLRLVLRIHVRGIDHLDTLKTGGLVIANHPGNVKQGIWLAWLARHWARLHPDGGPLLFFAHPNAALPVWLRPWLPPLLIQTADPLAQQGDHALPATTRRLADHLRAGGAAMVFPIALPMAAVSVARAQNKPYGWSLLAAQQANVPVWIVTIEQIGREVNWTILPPRAVSFTDDPEPRTRRQAAGQWAQDRLGEAALAHHLGRHTLWQVLCRATRQYGRQRLILTDATGLSATYGQLLTRALILGELLAKQTQPGAYVGLLLPTSIAATTTFFALQAIGRIPALLNFTAGPGPVCSACRTARIQTVYTSRRFVHKAKLEALVTALQQESQVIFLEEVRRQIKPWQALSGWWRAWCPEKSAQRLAPQGRPGQPAVVLFTSGSEGEPKGVVLSHDNLLANGVQVRTRIDIHPDDILLNVLPVFHAFGLTVGTLFPLWAGIRCHGLPSPLDYHLIPEVAYTLRATLLAGTDTFLAGYARAADPSDFLWMRHVVAGAEPLREETYRLWMERFGIRILEGYGTTEASPVLAVNTPQACRFGSVGRLVPGVEYRLDPVPDMTRGALLVVRGPNIMLGYLLPGGDGHYHPPVSQHGAGWYASGDIVHLDAQGFLHILGRAKRFAKVGGEMISLAAVEQLAALTWPEYRHAAVSLSAGRHETGGRKGEHLILVTECPHPDRRALLSQLRTKGMGEMYLPGKIVSVSAIPLLGSGKTDFAAVQTLAAHTIQEKNHATTLLPVFSVDHGQPFP
ncbi:MAG: AMP-binding protein [Magnetococcales bacterium]|nr:AMP-binding protein [Magnetococcales bacterium]